ncbi:MAG: thioredoxin domain-containing protein [Candidatus Omnitrophica bacterium]|nr:thioredoxin domain-containing protein [Candidatus Omnitrophota bacterium]
MWKKDTKRVIQASEDITTQLQNQAFVMGGEGLTKNTLQKGYEQLKDRFDIQFGGFGTAPKFPAPHNLSFILRWWKQSGDNNALAMVEKTLDNMDRGGIHDHIGSGFHRYSTDAKWLVPHFEKMLYDQAMLAIAYIEAYQATKKESYAEAARDIFTYVLSAMTSPEGGFYSAEDADSEGVEGKFYVWTQEEIKKILGEKTGDIFCRFYGGTKGGNFEGGRSILNIEIPLDTFAKKEGIGPADLKNILEESRRKLFIEREKRIHPHKDDKILTDWNGLMIAALAKGAQALDEPEYAKAAARAADFILKRLRRVDGRLLHMFRDGESPLPGYLDDYAFLVWGLIDLYESTFDVRYLKEAISLNEEMLKLFWDKKDGGLFFSGEDNEKLIMDRKEIYDGAIPSGNSVAALNLLRLGRITANGSLEKKAEELMNAFSSTVGDYPMGYSQLLIALDFAIGPSKEIVIAGEPGSEDTMEMLKVIRSQFLPRKIVLLHPGGKNGEEIEKIAAFLKEQRAINGKATAYVCENYACKLPTTNIKELEKLLGISE